VFFEAQEWEEIVVRNFDLRETAAIVKKEALTGIKSTGFLIVMRINFLQSFSGDEILDVE